ncbi:MAG: penicillin-binding protein 2 [Verrucomicrobiota bacterium]
MPNGYSSSYRIVLLSSGLFVCFGAMAVRLVWLHVVNRDELLGSIVRTRHQLIDETGKRGNIYDARGRPRGVTLATNRSMRVLGVDPHSLRPQDEAKWPELSRLLGMPEGELRRILTTKYRAAVVAPTAAKSTPEAAGLVFNLNLPAAEPKTEPVPETFEQAAFAVNVAPLPKAVEPAAAADSDETEVEATADSQGRRAIRWAKLHEDVSEDLYEKIKKLGIRGVYGDVGYRRTYPSNKLASHVVGFVNKAQSPGAGVEAFANFYLKSQNGWRVGERDGRNRELAQFRTREVPKIDGCNVTLTLDLLVQDIIEQEVAAIVEKFGPSKVSIVVSRPRTGYILGMANYPTFNLNEYSKVQNEFNKVQKLDRYAVDPMRNAAVADIYEPGSVFKIVAASAALEEGLVTPERVFDCEIETVMIEGKKVSMPKEDHRMGDLTVSEIISHSSNKGAAQLALLVGKDKFYGYIWNFGFGHRLGFPFGGEESGIIYCPEQWAAKDITRIPMGHTVSATVLQMHQAMCVIANDGVLMRPQIISQITEPTGEIVYRNAPEAIRRVVSPKTARAVAKMLMGVVEPGHGTAKEAAIAGFDVAGKTGTTQNFIYEYRADGSRRPIGYSNKSHVASFVGFFPAGNPQVAISVIVDEAKVTTGRGVAYGRIVAAPSFKRIGERLIPILNIQSNNAASPGLLVAHEGVRR